MFIPIPIVSDPDWIRNQSGQWFRIWFRNPDPDPGADFFQIIVHQYPGFDSGLVFNLKCWIRIRNKWIRIRKSVHSSRVFFLYDLMLANQSWIKVPGKLSWIRQFCKILQFVMGKVPGTILFRICWLSSLVSQTDRFSGELSVKSVPCRINSSEYSSYCFSFLIFQIVRTPTISQSQGFNKVRIRGAGRPKQPLYFRN